MTKLCLHLLGGLLLLGAFAPNTQAKSLVDYHENSVLPEDLAYSFPSCDVFCTGPILHTVQMAHLYPDSKTFVDMKLKYSVQKTKTDFDTFMAQNNDDPKPEAIQNWVDTYFAPKGSELIVWSPPDWKSNPTFLDKVNDPSMKQWAKDLNQVWKDLGRIMTDDVHKNPDLYSIIPVPNGVIVPGGRFIEFYYWDSYWVIRGLLYSEMFNTARGMLENFLSIVNRMGFVPNGGRVYYGGRSQPPLLAGMVKSYVDFTKDKKFAISAVETLEHEFEYWMNNHMVEVNGHSVATYRDTSTGPRPESYREDVLTGVNFPNAEDRENHYAELKAAAESGMDFSSRWFINAEGSREGSLKDIKTRYIVPVELNSFLYWNAKIIAEFYLMDGNTTKAKEYEGKAEKLKAAIEAVHWNAESGVWLDYDLINKKHRDYFVPTNLAPLWVKAYNTNESEKLSQGIMKYIAKNKLDSYPGGVPNTLYKTGEQWDYPNVWPPMQYLLVVGLENLGTPEAKKMSLRWGHRWVQSNFAAYQDSQDMYEKYNCEQFGGHGGGGEYGVQKGFGWTNGIIIEFLAKYGQDITPTNTAATKVVSIVGVAAVALLATVLGRYIW